MFFPSYHAGAAGSTVFPGQSALLAFFVLKCYIQRFAPSSDIAFPAFISYPEK